MQSIKQKVRVTGVKRARGEFEGTKYDSTKFFVETDLDDRTGNAKGTATTEYTMGTFDEYAKFENLSYPFDAEAELEIVTTGKGSKIVLASLKPIQVNAPKL